MKSYGRSCCENFGDTWSFDLAAGAFGIPGDRDLSALFAFLCLDGLSLSPASADWAESVFWLTDSMHECLCYGFV